GEATLNAAGQIRARAPGQADVERAAHCDHAFDRREPAPSGRITEVLRARVAVVADERRPGDTGAAVARLLAVAHVAVPARGAVGRRRPGHAAASGSERLDAVARIAVVAREARGPEGAGTPGAGILIEPRRADVDRAGAQQRLH